MAVAYTHVPRIPPMVAVDTTRFAGVGAWTPGNSSLPLSSVLRRIGASTAGAGSARPPAGRERLMAFVCDGDTEASLSSCLSHLPFPNPTIKRGGIPKAIQHLGVERSPETIIVDISGVEMPVSRVHDLVELCDPGITVIAIGDRNDVGLYRDLIQAGISEYIVKPVTAQLLAKALSPAPQAAGGSQISRKLGRLVAVVGARGGVGVTTLAIIQILPRFTRNVPAALVALIAVTAASVAFAVDAPRIGAIPAGLPAFVMPELRFDQGALVLSAALQLALLGAIDSLLGALLADSLTKTHHDSDRGLIGQGIGNMGAALVAYLRLRRPLYQAQKTPRSRPMP